MDGSTKIKVLKFAFWAFVLTTIIHYWPSTWWPNDTGSDDIPTIPTTEREITWNGYDPLVIEERIEPGEYVSMRLEEKNRFEKVSISYGRENGKLLTARIFGTEGYVIRENEKYYKYRPFQYDDKGRKIPPLAVVAVLTPNTSEWWSIPFSMVSWTKDEEYKMKDVCKNNLNQTATCLLVLNSPKGYRSDEVFFKKGYTMTFMVTKHFRVRN